MAGVTVVYLDRATIDDLPARVDVKFTAGRAAEWSAVLPTDDNGDPIDLTGWTLTATILGVTSPPALVTPVVDSGSIVWGIGAVSAATLAAGRWRYEIVATKSGEPPWTFIAGRLIAVRAGMMGCA